MLAALLNIPKTEQDWDIWSLSNYDAVNQVNGAILRIYGVNLPQYQLQPIPFNDINSWLNNNQQAHFAFTSVLRQQANDLLGVDFKDENQKEAWIYLNYKELQDACMKLGIGP